MVELELGAEFHPFGRGTFAAFAHAGGDQLAFDGQKARFWARGPIFLLTVLTVMLAIGRDFA